MYCVDGLAKRDLILIGWIYKLGSRHTCGRIEEGDGANYRNADRSEDSISSRHLSISDDFEFAYHPSLGMAWDKACKINLARLIKLPHQTAYLAWL